jgi:hypothetical protein
VAPVNPTRLVLLEMPGILADLIRQAIAGHDVEIVAFVRDVPELESVVQETEVDLVIVGLAAEASELGRFDKALDTRPGMRVLAIEGDGRTACMYMLVPRIIPLGPLSPSTLIELIRATRSGAVPPEGWVTQA